jgi:hypothetical protein
MKAARMNLDTIGGSAIVSGENTVFVNDQPIAVVSSTTAKGVAIVSGSTTVFAGKATKQVGRFSDISSSGQAVQGGSPNVFVGPGPN